ncbi:MAG: hypothetical protein Q9170_005578, partial [Blastenia crenularia]
MVAPDTPLQRSNSQKSQIQYTFEISPDILIPHSGIDVLGSRQQAAEDGQTTSEASAPGERAQIGSVSVVSSEHGPSLDSHMAPPADDRSTKFTVELAVRRFSDPLTKLERQNAQQTSTPQKEPELVEVRHSKLLSIRLSQGSREKARMPRPVKDRLFELETRRINVQRDRASIDQSPSTEAKTDPPLYGNLEDRMRQMNVELLLLRSEVAWSMRHWKAMENYGRKAHDLACHLQCEPFTARCAFPIGVALYEQRNWLEAHENFEEAEKTGGYYIDRRVIAGWLEKTLAKLEASAGPWSNGVSTPLGERAPSITPSASAVEEQEDFPLMAGETTTGSTIPRYINNNANVSPSDRSLPLPHQHQRLVATVRLASNPTRARLATGGPLHYNPDHGVPSPSPPPRGNSTPLRSGLDMGPTPHASNLSEMVLPDPVTSPRSAVDANLKSASSSDKSAASGGVPLPEWAIPQRHEPKASDQNPLSSSSFHSRKVSPSPATRQPSESPGLKDGSAGEQVIRSRDSPISGVFENPPFSSTVPDSASSTTGDFSALVQDIRDTLPTNSSQASIPLSPIARLHMQSQTNEYPAGPPSFQRFNPRPASLPQNHKPPTTPQLPNLPPRSADPEQSLSERRRQHDLEAAKIESQIQNILA